MRKKKLEKLMYKIFDGNLTDKEAYFLNNELRTSEELQDIYKEIKKIRQSVKDISGFSFKPFFEERLLDKIKYEDKQNVLITGLADSLVKSFRQVAITAVILLVLLIFYNINRGNNSSIENLLGTYKTPLEYVLDPTIHYFWSAI